MKNFNFNPEVAGYSAGLMIGHIFNFALALFIIIFVNFMTRLVCLVVKEYQGPIIFVIIVLFTLIGLLDSWIKTKSKHKPLAYYIFKEDGATEEEAEEAGEKEKEKITTPIRSKEHLFQSLLLLKILSLLQIILHQRNYQIGQQKKRNPQKCPKERILMIFGLFMMLIRHS